MVDFRLFTLPRPPSTPSRDDVTFKPEAKMFSLYRKFKRSDEVERTDDPIIKNKKKKTTSNLQLFQLRQVVKRVLVDLLDAVLVEVPLRESKETKLFFFYCASV